MGGVDVSRKIGMELSARGIVHTYRDFSLNIPELVLEKGTTTALLGPSGSGKSTLLGILGYLEKPQQGEVLLDGTPLTAKRARDHITAVLQMPYLMKGTVERNVAYGLKLRHVPVSERRARVCDMLTLVGLRGYENRSIAGLSGGESQRVALARALVIGPSVLLLDEPLSSLDEHLKERLAFDFAKILKESKITALYVTHDKNEARTVANSHAVMSEGRIVSHS